MIGFLNKFIFQFFFLRLTKCTTILQKGDIDSHVHYWYSIQFFVIPFSGYGREFRYLGEKKFVKISPQYLCRK